MRVEAKYHFEKVQSGRSYLMADQLPDSTNVPRLDVSIRYPDGQERIYPVFAQSAGQYNDYSDYMTRHGCACCSLTTLLAAYRRHFKDLNPGYTVLVEADILGEEAWIKNYSKSIARQMPISLYGISRILSHYHIPNQYVRDFQDDEAVREIKNHLYHCHPVVVETSRVRRKNSHVASIFDKKYAGSYHTMILLGIDMEGYAVMTDSAFRSWSGNHQRLKRVRLEELINYMYPQKSTRDRHLYFSKRRNTGGYLLINEIE